MRECLFSAVPAATILSTETVADADLTMVTDGTVTTWKLLQHHHHHAYSPSHSTASSLSRLDRTKFHHPGAVRSRHRVHWQLENRLGWPDHLKGCAVQAGARTLIRAAATQGATGRNQAGQQQSRGEGTQNTFHIGSTWPLDWRCSARQRCKIQPLGGAGAADPPCPGAPYRFSRAGRVGRVGPAGGRDAPGREGGPDRPRSRGALGRAGRVDPVRAGPGLTWTASS